MKFNINFKEGFKRITLVVCALILLLGTIYSFDYSWRNLNNKLLKKITVSEVGLKDNKKIKYLENIAIKEYLYDYGYIVNDYNFITENLSVTRKKNWENKKISIYKISSKLTDVKINYANNKIKNTLSFLYSFVKGVLITIIVSSINYFLFLITCWVFSGFKNKRDS